MPASISGLWVVIVLVCQLTYPHQVVAAPAAGLARPAAPMRLLLQEPAARASGPDTTRIVNTSIEMHSAMTSEGVTKIMLARNITSASTFPSNFTLNALHTQALCCPPTHSSPTLQTIIPSSNQ
jgi:hypothetical protein